MYKRQTEILEKKYFQELRNFGKEHFNYIIIDCAPIGAAIDAAVVAKYCDGAIIVIGPVSYTHLDVYKRQVLG